jgi:hypothetical protein
VGKRSSFPRRRQDKYLTFDRRAGATLAPHLAWGCRFWEPCAAAGHLVHQIEGYGAQCLVASDIEPGAEGVFRVDALKATRADILSTGATHIITNPPWTREILHAMILHFSSVLPTWLLFDADWVHTAQAALYLPRLQKIVSVGRLCWIEGTNQTGKDNVSWHLFDARHSGPTEFVGRLAA